MNLLCASKLVVTDNSVHNYYWYFKNSCTNPLCESTPDMATAISGTVIVLHYFYCRTVVW